MIVGHWVPTSDTIGPFTSRYVNIANATVVEVQLRGDRYALVAWFDTGEVPIMEHRDPAYLLRYLDSVLHTGKET